MKINSFDNQKYTYSKMNQSTLVCILKKNSFNNNKKRGQLSPSKIENENWQIQVTAHSIFKEEKKSTYLNYQSYLQRKASLSVLFINIIKLIGSGALLVLDLGLLKINLFLYF